MFVDGEVYVQTQCTRYWACRWVEKNTVINFAVYVWPVQLCGGFLILVPPLLCASFRFYIALGFVST